MDFFVAVSYKKDSDVLPAELDSDTELSDIFDISAGATSLVRVELAGTPAQFGYVWREDGGAEPTLSDHRTRFTGQAGEHFHPVLSVS